MGNPISSNFPLPSGDQTGWPWAEAVSLAKYTEFSNWPRITIVTPNYNFGEFLERTIRSVLLQNYPNLEYMIIDGASTDNSIEIIRKYEPWLDYWVSEKDNGQSHAINKGFNRATGDMVTWLNSDDILLPDALYVVGKYLKNLPYIDVLAGACKFINVTRNDETIFKATPEKLYLLPIRCIVWQPSCFYKRQLLDRKKPVDETYEYAMDHELWNYFLSKRVRWHCIDEVLSAHYNRPGNKTNTGGFKIALEKARVYRTYVKEPIPLTFWHRWLRYPLEWLEVYYPRTKRAVRFIWRPLTSLLSLFYGRDKVEAMKWKRWVIKR
jgi:glycosyltransferase involved in cell wall biosynthesis